MPVPVSDRYDETVNQSVGERKTVAVLWRTSAFSEVICIGAVAPTGFQSGENSFSTVTLIGRPSRRHNCYPQVAVFFFFHPALHWRTYHRAKGALPSICLFASFSFSFVHCTSPFVAAHSSANSISLSLILRPLSL